MSSEAWAPDWATPELQRAQLAEVEELLAAGNSDLTADEAGLATLRAAVARGELLLEGAGLRCELRCPAGHGQELLAAFTLPPLYPTIPLRVALTFAGQDATDMDAELLAALDAALREQATQQAAGGRALEAALEWLRANAAVEVERLRAELAPRRAAAPPRGRAAARPAEPPPEPAAPAVRKAEKFSPNWDLCTAFVKQGKCKNKNCKWRHERPVAALPKEEPTAAEPQEVSKPKGGTTGKKKKN